MAQRDLYRRCVDEWLPEHDSRVPKRFAADPALTRVDTFEIVLNEFNKREEYLKVVEEWKKERVELLEKQQARNVKKREALDLKEYANSWIRWLEHDTQSKIVSTDKLEVRPP